MLLISYLISYCITSETCCNFQSFRFTFKPLKISLIRSGEASETADKHQTYHEYQVFI